MEKINQYSLDGNFICCYDNSHLAEESTGVSSSKIIACCKGKRGKSGNYQWRYTDDELESLPKYKKKQKNSNEQLKDIKVFRYKNGGYEKESTLGKEANILNTTVGRIRYAIKNNLTIKGYKFYYDKQNKKDV